MMGFIRKLVTLQKLFKILKFIDPKKLQGINDILEQIYPGIKDEIKGLVERGDLHAMNKTLDYIKAHGGAEKMAEYYNDADQKGKEEMVSAFKEAFRTGAPFEDAVLTLDSMSKVNGMGVYTQLFGDVKDVIVKSSIELHYRTVYDWRTFVRRQHEANKGVLLGVLDEIQEHEEKNKTKTGQDNRSSKPDDQPDNSPRYAFNKELLSELYEDYDGIVFKHISSGSEFASIIKRKEHKEKLVDCFGKKVLVYHILWRLRILLPEDKRDVWIEDIAVECGYDVTTISKKYKDANNMKDENKKLLGKMSSLFDRYETLR